LRQKLFRQRNAAITHPHNPIFALSAMYSTLDFPLLVKPTHWMPRETIQQVFLLSSLH
jgi:hypothetical protein